MKKLNLKSKLSKVFGVIKKYKIVIIILVVCITVALGYGYKVKQDKLKEQQRIQQEAIQKQKEKEKAEKEQKEIENKNKKELTDILLKFESAYFTERDIMSVLLSNLCEATTQQERCQIVNNDSIGKLKELQELVAELNKTVTEFENHDRFKSGKFATDKQIHRYMKNICSCLERENRFMDKMLKFALSNCDPSIIDDFEGFIRKQDGNRDDIDKTFEEFLKVLCTNYYDGNYVY